MIVLAITLLAMGYITLIMAHGRPTAGEKTLYGALGYFSIMLGLIAFTLALIA